MCLVVVPLLVTYTQILQVEWLWMAHLGAHLTPLAVGRTVSKLNQVECILDIWLQILECYVYTRLGRIRVLELTRESA